MAKTKNEYYIICILNPKMKCSICKKAGHNKRSCKPMTTTELLWNHWTDNSRSIPFKSITKGVGDGEAKVARELGTTILGQNSPYDMKAIIGGMHVKCDVKKLDTQNDFNTGVKGRNALRLIKTKLVLLLESLDALSKNPLFTSDEHVLLKGVVNVSPDELAVGTLKRLKEVCKMLNKKWKTIKELIPVVQPFKTSSGVSVNIPLDVYYELCEKIDLPFQSEYSLFESNLQTLKQLDNPYIKQPDLLTDDLNSLVKCLADTTIIVVDEEKGYTFVTDTSKVQFLRITRGNPRFQII